MSHSTSSALTLSAFLLQMAVPSALAAGTCSVAALDTIAGLGTEVSITSCEAGLQTLLVIQSPENQTYTQHITLDPTGNAITLVPSSQTVTTGTYGVSVAGRTTQFIVLPDRPDDTQSTLIASPQSIDADGEDSATVTAILRDRNGNPVEGRPLALIASRLSDEITTHSVKTDDSGRFVWIVRSREQGTSTLTVYDIIGGRQMKLKVDLKVGSSFTQTTSRFAASLTRLGQGGDPALAAELGSEVIDHFDLSLTTDATEVKANELFGMTIRAMRGTEVARGYVGSLTVKSSDPDAVLPKQGEDPRDPMSGHIDIRGVDQGERKVPLAFMLRNSGTQTIEVSDDLDPTFTGKITLRVTRSGAAGDSKIAILDPQDRTSVKGGPILLQGRAPSLINLRVKGGMQTIDGESDQEGVFRISVPINPADREVTLFVESENGTYESAPVHILIDDTPPSIATINLNPPEAKAGEKATITVQSEAGLSSVTATSGQQTVTLTGGSGGLYTGSLNAPSAVGMNDITVTAKDAAGNEATMLTKWNVLPTTLPIVQNVKAETKEGAISVTWDAVVGVSVSQYKIYISDKNDPSNILYSVGTGKPVTSVLVKDLPAGKTYQLTMTVVATDGTESPERSAPVFATPLGIALKATPGNDSLMLEWTPIPSLPLDHYILQYGIAGSSPTERRTVNGLASSFALRDLIGGMTYELRLTPVTVTGKELPEAAAMTQGTPVNNGFVAGTVESVPTNISGGHSGAPILPSPSLDRVPVNTGSGIPSMALGLLGILTFGFGLHYHRAQREKRRVDAFLQAMEQRYLS